MFSRYRARRRAKRSLSRSITIHHVRHVGRVYSSTARRPKRRKRTKKFLGIF